NGCRAGGRRVRLDHPAFHGRNISGVAALRLAGGALGFAKVVRPEHDAERQHDTDACDERATDSLLLTGFHENLHVLRTWYERYERPEVRPVARKSRIASNSAAAAGNL